MKASNAHTILVCTLYDIVPYVVCTKKCAVARMRQCKSTIKRSKSLSIIFMIQHSPVQCQIAAIHLPISVTQSFSYPELKSTSYSYNYNKQANESHCQGSFLNSLLWGWVNCQRHGRLACCWTWWCHCHHCVSILFCWLLCCWLKKKKGGSSDEWPKQGWPTFETHDG